MSNDETKNAWMTHFKIIKECVKSAHATAGYPFSNFEQYYIADAVSNEKIHGPYRDFVYAKKQARRKYRKLVRNMERVLMS